MNKSNLHCKLLLIFLLLSFFLASCNTLKGAGTGLTKDCKEGWSAVMKADKWFKENAW